MITDVPTKVRRANRAESALRGRGNPAKKEKKRIPHPTILHSIEVWKPYEYVWWKNEVRRQLE